MRKQKSFGMPTLNNCQVSNISGVIDSSGVSQPNISVNITDWSFVNIGWRLKFDKYTDNKQFVTQPPEPGYQHDIM